MRRKCIDFILHCLHLMYRRILHWVQHASYLFVFSFDSLCKCDIFLQDGCIDKRFLPALIEYTCTCLLGLTYTNWTARSYVRSDLVITKVFLDQIVITLIMLVNGINYLMQLIPYFSWSLFSPDLLNLYIILGCGYLTFSFNPNTAVYKILRSTISLFIQRSIVNKSM